jgi:spermidine synthase
LILLDEEKFSENTSVMRLYLELSHKLHEEKTPHQDITVYETETFGRLMTMNNIPVLTSRNSFIYNEMMAHPILFNHPNPKDVAIVGGGNCGTLKEVLKHDTVKQVMQVESDERVTRVSEKYFPELCEENNDSRATFLFEDVITYMQKVESESLDVIILDTTDPVGQAKYLFQETFYRNCLNALREGGMIVGQSGSPLMTMAILTDICAEMRKADYTEIQTIQFPAATCPSGWWTATMARKGQKFGDFREQMARHKPFDTRYYNADIHKACSAMPQFMQDAY